jgi:hypothetical protein
MCIEYILFVFAVMAFPFCVFNIQVVTDLLWECVARTGNVY